MDKLTIIEKDGPLNRSLHYLACDQVVDIPKYVSLLGKNFAPFLALDASKMDVNEISDIAEKLLSDGLAYVCVWGPNCEWVHDIFDSVYVGKGDGLSDDMVFMSTWHSNEPLSEALWFFLYNTRIDESHNMECSNAVAVVVNNEEWSTRTQSWLLNLAELKRVVGL
jgi:hypothetical protein